MTSAISCTLLVLACAGCQFSRNSRSLEGRAADTWTRSYPLAADGEVQIEGASGSIDVRGGGSTVEVSAERVVHASTNASASEILPRVVIREDIAPDKVQLETKGLEGLVIGVQVEVNYRVTVPPAARVRLRTVSGAVTLAELDGGVTVSSVNGSVIGTGLRGGVDAKIVNGPMSITLGSFGRDPVDLRAINGRMDLLLPKDANASVDVTCVNGTIDVRDLGLVPFGEQTRRRVRGRLNAGGPPITVATTNGNIHVGLR